MPGKKWGAARPVTHGARWTPERRLEARSRYEAGAALGEIAEAMQTTANRTREAILAAGGQMRRRGPRDGHNAAWRGGRVVDKTGYILLRATAHPHANMAGYVREHRLVMEQMLGRYLQPSEVVHHRNGVSDDNRPENLELFVSNASHLAHELQGRCPQWTPAGRERILAALHSRPKKAAPTREQTNARARELYAKRRARLRSGTP